MLRRYNEFYVLESKLMEFHGNLGIVSLPTKKLLGRSFDFIESKRTDFEKFLRVCKLLYSLRSDIFRKLESVF